MADGRDERPERPVEPLSPLNLNLGDVLSALW